MTFENATLISAVAEAAMIGQTVVGSGAVNAESIRIAGHRLRRN